jgi:hypothetical protein
MKRLGSSLSRGSPVRVWNSTYGKAIGANALIEAFDVIKEVSTKEIYEQHSAE